LTQLIVITKKQNNNLPALSENAFIRYINFIALYVAQGIPEGMAFYGIPAWLAMNGKTAGEIASFVAIVGLPWSFKIIVAPLMDRFTFLSMGRKRPWVLFGQLGLMGSFIAMALVPDPLNNLNLLMLAGFAVGFFGSFQDVATDGMAIDIIPINQQARANGLMWGAKIMGISGSLALGSLLLNQYGYMTSILMLSIAVCLIMLFPLFLRERPNEKLLPWTAGSASPESKNLQLKSWSEIVKSLWSAFSLNSSLLLALIIFVSQGAFNFMGTFLPIFTVKALNWTDLEYSKFFSTASLIGGIGGMLLGGILIEKYGKIRMLNFYYFLLIVLTLSLSLSSVYWEKFLFIGGFMILYQTLYVFACVGIFSVAMEFCWKKVSASQFTLYMTVGNLGRLCGAKIIGPIKEQFDWNHTILTFSILIAIAWIVMQFLDVTNQMRDIELLEIKENQGN